jgi:hypothetical protein
MSSLLFLCTNFLATKQSKITGRERLYLCKNGKMLLTVNPPFQTAIETHTTTTTTKKKRKGSNL